jgi:hypothetical protein
MIEIGDDRRQHRIIASWVVSVSFNSLASLRSMSAVAISWTSHLTYAMFERLPGTAAT